MAGDKYYKAERARQAKFREAEKYARLFPEDSTREYNPVEHYKDGGLVGRGQGRTIKTKKTKMY